MWECDERMRREEDFSFFFLERRRGEEEDLSFPPNNRIPWYISVFYNDIGIFCEE